MAKRKTRVKQITNNVTELKLGIEAVLKSFRFANITRPSHASEILADCLNINLKYIFMYLQH